MNRTLNYLLISVLLLISCSAQTAEKIVLQLKWEHEFQFAGYYAALWQGYYESEGLDVEIRPISNPDGSLVSPAQELSKGNADFAIGATDILIHRDQGEKFVVLAPLFQRSPNAIFALPGTPLDSVADLAKLTIGISNDFTGDETRALFNKHGIDLSSIQFKHITPTISALINGEVDAIATYGVSATFAAQEKGVTLQHLTPSDQGLDFYGDTLYTHQRVTENNPEMVRKFLRASLKGWQYALNNKDEIAANISSKLPRHLFSYDDFKAYNLAFAEMLGNYMAYPITEIGHNNRTRWRNMHDHLKALGVVENEWDESLFFNELEATSQAREISILEWGFAFITLVSILFSVYFLRREQNIWLPCLLFLFAVILIESFLESNLQKEHYRSISLNTAQQLNSVSGRIVGTLSNSLSLLSATAAYISMQPDIEQRDFERFTRPLLQNNSLLVNLAAARDLVVNLVYPLEGNEAVVGLNYLKHKEQRAAVLSVKDQKSTVIVGPVRLVQGGVSFIARTGVYTENSQGESVFWGIVSAPIDAQQLYKNVGLMDKDLDSNIAIRSKDLLGGDGGVFFGDVSVFEDKRAIKSSITIGDSTWLIAASPKNGWNSASVDIWVLRITTVVLTAILLLFISYRHRMLKESRAYEQQLHQSEKLLSDVGELAQIGPWKINHRGVISSWHQQTSRILDLPYPIEGFFLEMLASTFPSDQLNLLQTNIDASRQSGISFDLELYRFGDQQEKSWLRFIGEPVLRLNNLYDILGAFQDITERKRNNELIQYQASYDTLTGLPNRFLLDDRLDKAISKAKRDSEKLAVLFVDLDNFKPVNDNLGHQAGDQLLKEVSKRLISCVRTSDTVARYSGDEFILVLQDVDDGSGSLSIAEQLIHTINKPFVIENNEIFCGLSVGIAIYPDDGVSAETLILNADHAMYEVKKSGRNGWHFFTEKMQQQSEKRHRMHNKLQSALSNRDLSVYYQPIIDLNNGNVSKCESLVRWFEVDGNQIPTDEFISLAEDMGIINDIDFLVLEEAGHFLSQLVVEKGVEVGLSVNVSPRIFTSKDKSLANWLSLVTRMAKQINVTVEITERVLTQDSEKALHALNQLKEAGITIAIDDFGTGYSSLSYLTKFPIDYIKIDRSFISNIGINESDETLIETIISLANKLSMKVVAEGIETQEQLDFLKHLKCDYAQGYLLGRPQPADDFTTLIESGAVVDVAKGEERKPNTVASI